MLCGACVEQYLCGCVTHTRVRTIATQLPTRYSLASMGECACISLLAHFQLVTYKRQTLIETADKSTYASKKVNKNKTESNEPTLINYDVKRL